LGDILYYRYVKTATLSRVIEPLKNEQICALKAHRTFTRESSNILPELNYVKIKEKTTLKVDIDFNSLNHGLFDKDKVMRILEESGAEEAIITELDLKIPEKLQPKIGKLMVRLRDDSSFQNLQYIAHFERYPCRREGEDNKFVQEIKDFRTDTDMRQGFEPSSLDFQYPIWTQIWRDISRMSRRSVSYQETLNYLKQINIEDNEIQREIVITLFPKWMSSGRMYRRKRGKEKWILSSVGDI